MYCVIVLFFLLQAKVTTSNNAGLYFHNLTNINQPCSSSACDFAMHICYSLLEDTCDLENFTSNAWTISLGNSRIFQERERLVSGWFAESNPLTPNLDFWKNQRVSLNITIKEVRGQQEIILEDLYFEALLPYPAINTYDIGGILKNSALRKRSCGRRFCLDVSFYMWCRTTRCVVYSTSPIFGSPMTKSTWPRLISSTSTVSKSTFSNPKTHSSLLTSACSMSCGTASGVKRMKSSKIHEKWWFLLVLISAGILIIAVLILAILHYKKQKKIGVIINNQQQGGKRTMELVDVD